MTKLAFFIRSMSGGGAQRAMVRLASGFSDIGYDVEVLTLQPDGPFRNELSSNVVVTPLSSSRISTSLFAITRYLRRTGPAAMLVTEPASNIMVIAAKLISRSDSTLLIRESLFPSIALRESPHLSTRLAYIVAPLLYRYADNIVALADEMAVELARVARVKRERITTVAINPVVTAELEQASIVTPSHVWFRENTPIILGVGRLDRQKDFLVLLRAFEQVRRTRSCRLLIVGDGPMRKTLECARMNSRYSNDIDMPGFEPSPFSYMAHCSVFVLSSRYEGLPNALVEALACGAPVVATDCPSGPKEVLDGGRYGRLTPVGDAARMAKAIVETLDEPIDRKTSQARGLFYSIVRSTQSYEKVLFPDRD